MPYNTVKVFTLLDEVGAVGAGSSFQINSKDISFQVIISDTATVAMEVSNDGTNWYSHASSTASVIHAMIQPFKYFRGNVTAWTSGTVTMLAAAL